MQAAGLAPCAPLALCDTKKRDWELWQAEKEGEPRDDYETLANIVARERHQRIHGIAPDLLAENARLREKRKEK